MGGGEKGEGGRREGGGDRKLFLFTRRSPLAINCHFGGRDGCSSQHLPPSPGSVKPTPYPLPRASLLTYRFFFTRGGSQAARKSIGGPAFHGVTMWRAGGLPFGPGWEEKSDQSRTEEGGGFGVHLLCVQ